MRPPSVPLAVRTPYLSTWLPATDLTAATPRFWDGVDRSFAGLVRIDGQVYVWAGEPLVRARPPQPPRAHFVEVAPPMLQTCLQVTATRSIFTSEAAGVELVSEWLSPVEPGDVRLQSVPLSLLTVSIRALDGSAHSVQVYADVTGEWATSNETDEIEWHVHTSAKSLSWTIELQDPQPVTEYKDMAQWGTAIWSTAPHATLSYQSGWDLTVRDQFAEAGVLSDTADPDFRATGDNQPVFAFARDLGVVDARGQSVTFVLGHVRSPAFSYGQEATPLTSLWTRYWPTWQSMVDTFFSDAAAARRRAIALDAKIERAATRVAGPGYSGLCALAVRQAYGGTELAIGPQGRPWAMLKEISSDGDTNTVDIMDAAMPIWLWLDPGYVPLVMEPILDWCSSPAWQDPAAWAGIASWEQTQTRYCVHDLGPYPQALGRAPGDGEQMPIDESAGMLIMAAAYARQVSSGEAAAFLAPHRLLWTQWAEYLLTQVPTPATQLTTDDYVTGYQLPTGSVNLGIKAIIGLAAAGQIASLLGDGADAATWSQAAADNVAPWVALSMDPSGRFLNLEQGAAGTWSTLYNAYFEQVIGTSLVPGSVAEKQASFYLSQLSAYGMPLQTSCDEWNKVEWLFFTAAWLPSYPISRQLIARSIAYVNDTPTRVPYGDRYHPFTGVDSHTRAHPTIGGVFALLL
ncbi:MAG: DUF5127 domain-containing protein [Acidimicrobiales bacterium]